ncbi:alginate O-acetyltransferase AlgX-related protein [Hyphococcus sp.]|uniref:alginate O-acetyltransferase AlgX-related protein n=1 Tax=Hyphococcus sp. TaxID=2038636 RepID=UPI002082B179|nr:MAG: hypothetical protein DHS20C04_13890 [Marinicaulis sp.]
MNLRISKYQIASLLFFALLFAPLCGQIITEKASISTLERRSLASFPTTKDIVNAPIAAPAKLSRWMEDHFGFRGRLIRLHAKITSELNLSDERHAVRGDDGWLFLATDKALVSHQGLNPFAPGELERWMRGAKTIKEAACGKPFVILIAPDKHTIYSEHLTRHPRRSDRPTRLETLVVTAPETALKLKTPIDAMRRAKQAAQLYYRTDSHWTERGAYEGYRTLMAMLAEEGVPVEVLAESQLDETGEANREGDLNNLLGGDAAPVETYIQWRLHDATLPRREEHLSEYDWNSVEAKRWETQNTGAPRLLVYGDSFFNALQPFLLQSFSTVTFVHHRLGEPPLTALDACDYDAVALEMVERFLSYDLAPAR